jgi:hypothetical protein
LRQPAFQAVAADAERRVVSRLNVAKKKGG